MNDAILASRLRERITIEQPARAPDTYGGGDISWSALATVYASVTPLLGVARETTVADQITAIAGYRVTIRKRTDVLPTMRIQWRARMLQIHSLHETEQTLEILAYEDVV